MDINEQTSLVKEISKYKPKKKEAETEEQSAEQEQSTGNVMKERKRKFVRNPFEQRGYSGNIMLGCRIGSPPDLGDCKLTLPLSSLVASW